MELEGLRWSLGQAAVPWEAAVTPGAAQAHACGGAGAPAPFSQYSSGMTTSEAWLRGLDSALLVGLALVVLAGYCHALYNRSQPLVLLGRSLLLRRVVAKCQSLSRPYAPPIWCASAWAQTFHACFRTETAKRESQRLGSPLRPQMLKMRDGQEVLLHWLDRSEVRCGSNGPRAVVLLLHTVTGISADHVPLMRKLGRDGILSVGFDRRGNSDLPLKHPRFNTTGCTQDLREVLCAIKRCYPRTPLFAVGYSAGSSLLARYLGEEGEGAEVDGAVLVSPGFDMEEAVKRHLDPIADAMVTGFAKWTFLRRLLESPAALEQLTAEQRQAVGRLKRARSMRDWHSEQHHFTGLGSEEEYYSTHNPGPVLARIAKPTLFVNAADDMMFPARLVEQWRHLPAANAHIGMVQTTRGGHCGFVQGTFAARSLTWAEIVVSEFLSMLTVELRLQQPREVFDEMGVRKCQPSHDTCSTVSVSSTSSSPASRDSFFNDSSDDEGCITSIPGRASPVFADR